MADELVFTVNGPTAESATPITLAEAGLKERTDLQEWVLANPGILGDGIMIVTCEFDRWKSAVGTEHDRLDVLGLDRAGRLVVAELKRDKAPDTVEMQAIKYAAMASRFTPEVLAAQHARFGKSRGTTMTDDEALDKLSEHTGIGLSSEQLARPRIVLVAAGFAPVVTASVVWLTEMGLDIALMEVHAYRTSGTQLVVTVSQLYPVKDVEDFTVAPRHAARDRAVDEYPEIEWTADDFVQLRRMVKNPTVVVLLEMCSAAPGGLVSLRDVEREASRTPAQARADLAGLTTFVKNRFGRCNWPLSVETGPDGTAVYVMTHWQAEHWIGACSAADEEVQE